MIGNIDPTQKTATVIGAGISGLLIAYALKKRGFQVKVLEASSRMGGLIETLETPFGIAERAAHSLMVTPESLKFFQELNIELCEINPTSKARYIYRHGKMKRMPLSLFEATKTLRRFVSAPKISFSPDSGSLEDWGNAYLGASATQYLLSPFVTGIFATHPKELLASLAFPRLVPTKSGISLYRHFKSVKKTARPKMMAPKNGMKELVNALKNYLKDEIQLNHDVDELPNHPNLILTVPSAALSELLQESDRSSAEKLLKVRYAPLISLTCFFKKEKLSKNLRGVGVLIPRGEGLRMLGCLFNSSAFPNRTADPSYESFTAMYGGTEDTEIMHLDSKALKGLVNQELQTLLGALKPADSIEISRWKQAIPIYSIELKEAQDSLKIGFCSKPGRVVFNNYSKDVSIRGLINATLQL